ncbi:hypothetical protein [Spirilliplanes yamanashiensis]|uniref:Uncharacterized protein n=1 Tax=Spirilliplanes yamanashiensis TaxID=42233 RepID=A0A8J4DIJ2_9ACTN|nr:hypothetical protein [Spirilliplanes yamanashiensis]MDP9814775.1 membrane protein implicated in regulation of membrane protease activity [Spirilliplanes yamanashiensis]GIJ02429.1 hypothetical protein Sya03_17810 [Spirilliplanes yamanashiensis]
MKYLIALAALVAVAVGAAAVVYGESDDSPGLQAIGVALVVGVIAYYGLRYARRRR